MTSAQSYTWACSAEWLSVTCQLLFNIQMLPHPERRLSSWWTRAVRVQKHNSKHRWETALIVIDSEFCGEPFFSLSTYKCFSLVCSGSISTADGSALVKVGNTTVICGIKAVNYHAHVMQLKTASQWIPVGFSDLCFFIRRSWRPRQWRRQVKAT